MAKKKILSKEIKAIKAAQDSNKLIIGTSQVLRSLRKGIQLKVVYTSSNCPQTLKDDLQVYCKLSGVELTSLSYPNDELGPLCKKQYFISVLGIQ